MIQKNKNQGIFVLVATVLGSAMSFIDYSALNVVLPILQKDLGATVSQVQWIVTGYILFLSAFILLGGTLGDIYGRRLIFAVGVMVFASASAACGLAPDARSLIIARCAQGFGGALLVPGSLSILNSYFDESEQPKAIGIWSAFSAITTASGPLVGGFLAEHFSWRYVFFINVPLALATLIMLFRFTPESRDETREKKLDVPGALLATLGLGGVTYALIEYSEGRNSSPAVILSVVLGVLALVLFVIIEIKSRNPMLPPKLFLIRNFAVTNALTLFLYAALGGMTFYMSFLLINVQDYTPTQAGGVFIPFVVMMFTVSLFSGRLTALVGRKALLVSGPICASVGFLLFIFVTAPDTPFWTGLLPVQMTMALGISLTVAPLTSAVMSSVEQRNSGIASGINNFISRVAGLLAIASLGIIIHYVFNLELDLQLLEIKPGKDVINFLAGERLKLSAMSPPEGVSLDLKATLEHAIKLAYARAFEVCAVVCAALGFLSGLIAFLQEETRS